MKTKIVGMIAAAVVLGAGVVGAQAATDASTPGFAIHGQLQAEGWVGPMNQKLVNNGATLHDDASYINFQYNFDQFSGAFTQINIGQLPGIENHSNGNVGAFNMDYLGDVKVWTDILGELGVEPVSLKLTLGKQGPDSAWNAPKAMGVNDNLQGDALQDNLNWTIDLGLNKDIFPLVLTLASDLDFGSDRNGANVGDGSWNDNGVTGFVQLASNGYANSAVSVDWNVYYGGGVHTTTGNIHSTGALNHHVGGTVGVGILGLPINLKVGGAVEYFSHKEYGAVKTSNHGVDWEAGVGIGKDQVFTLNAAFAGVKEYDYNAYVGTSPNGGATDGYNLDGNDAYGYMVGVDGSLDMIPKSSIYAGMNVLFGDGFKGDLNHRLSYEVGYKYKPTDAISLTTGWQHGPVKLGDFSYTTAEKKLVGADNHNVYSFDNAGHWYLGGTYTW